MSENDQGDFLGNLVLIAILAAFFALVVWNINAAMNPRTVVIQETYLSSYHQTINLNVAECVDTAAAARHDSGPMCVANQANLAPTVNAVVPGPMCRAPALTDGSECIEGPSAFQ